MEHSPALPADLVTPEQYTIIGHGAQYIVGMLTGPEATYREYWSGEEPAPRVLKLPLPLEYVERAVEEMGINEDDKALKVAMLVNSRQLHFWTTLGGTVFDKELWELLGRPRQAVMPSTDALLPSQHQRTSVITGSGERCVTTAFMPAYTQDYSPSLTPIIPSDIKTPTGQRLQRHIRRYAWIQRMLIGRGLFDDIFKLDNYGDNEHMLSIHDFSELQLDVALAEEAIRNRKWEAIVDNSEYTQLAPAMQDFFNDTLQKALPPSVIDTWGRHKPAETAANFRGVVFDIILNECLERTMTAFQKAAG